MEEFLFPEDLISLKEDKRKLASFVFNKSKNLNVSKVDGVWTIYVTFDFALQGTCSGKATGKNFGDTIWNATERAIKDGV